jgi:hypothetical protein
MQGNIGGSPRAAEARARVEHAASTTDFVHYVVHFAALREGCKCEMCSRGDDLQHTHYFEEAAEA